MESKDILILVFSNLASVIVAVAGMFALFVRPKKPLSEKKVDDSEFSSKTAEAAGKMVDTSSHLLEQVQLLWGNRVAELEKKVGELEAEVLRIPRLEEENRTITIEKAQLEMRVAALEKENASLRQELDVIKKNGSGNHATNA